MRSIADTGTPLVALSKPQTLLLLRWVLVIATSYLVLFSRPLSEIPRGAALFVAVYLASNLALSSILPKIPPHRLADTAIIIFDTVAVSVGLILTHDVSTEFFLLYFLIILMGAITERLGLLVGAAVLISGVHMAVVSRFLGFDHLLTGGYLLRFPFFLVVALFFGYLIENTRRVEEARSREILKNEFFSSITHDLKQPLHVIQLLSETLLEGDRPRTGGETDTIRRIHANARRVITLALNILDAGRIEVGRLTLRRLPSDVARVVEDATSLADSASRLKGVTLEYCAEAGLPPVSLDVTQFERVITNVVDNAIKYTPPGGSVSVAVSRDGESVRIDVRDDGPGIAQQDLPRLFDKYGRRGPSGRTEGTGLGLFIVRGIVEAHGGGVSVASAQGEGTTVTVRLPTAEAPDDRRASRESRKPSTGWMGAIATLRCALGWASRSVSRELK